MKVLTRQTILFFFLIVCTPLVDLEAQTTAEKKIATGSVSGNVTIKGKGAPGITVSLRNANRGDRAPGYQAQTDQDGNYRVANVPAGSYQVQPDAPSFYVSTRPGNGLVIIAEGESIEGIDFGLTKGGVITGRVRDSDGQPVVEVAVNLQAAAQDSQYSASLNMGGQGAQTDDRGVYRIYGLPQGKYRVFLAEGSGRRRSIHQTYHPGVRDVAKAAIVEVSEGTEVKNIDITVETNESPEKFSVTGHVVDSVSGDPVPNIRLSLESMRGGDQGYLNSSFSSDNRGQFKIERLAAGLYGIFVEPSPTSDLRADRVPVEVVDRDVDGVELKIYRGASVSGQVILEGDDKAVRAKFNQIFLDSYVQDSGGSFGRSIRLGEDLSFRVGGVKEGMVIFNLYANDGGPMKSLIVSRIERNGVVQTQGIEVKAGEQVDGVKIFVKVGTGSIRGIVKLENGELPSTARFSVWYRNPDSDPTKAQQRPALVDTRGHFVFEGMPAGTYEINVSVFIPGVTRQPRPGKQQVTVTDGVVTDVVIPLDLSPGP